MFQCESCRFYETNSCNDCKYCTYCGKRLYLDGTRKNIHGDHVMAYSKYGSTVVPSCSDCNMSKGNKGLKDWLRWLRVKRPDIWQVIVEYNLRKRNSIAQKVREVRYS